MLDLSGLDLEKENKNKIDLSGLELEKDDNTIDLSKLELEKEKNPIVKTLENTGSKIYDGINKITKPAIDTAKNINTVTDVIKNTVNPVNIVKNIANNSTVKEYNNVEPSLRARTKQDDNAKVIYEPDSFDILGNKIAVASAGGSVKNIEELKKLKDKQTFAVLSAQLPTLALTGAMPVTALAGFAGLQQLKNLIVTKAKGEKYSPMQIKMLAEMLPEDTNEYVKLGASLLEAVGDTAVIGAGVNKFKKTLLTDAANNTIDKLKKAGYKITPEQEQQFKTAVDKRVENISPDDAVAINIKTKMAKVPKATEKANIEVEPKRIDMERDIVNTDENLKINYEKDLKTITKQIENTKTNIVKQRLENVVENPTEETIKNFPNNVKGDFELVKGNIYKINNSSYGIYVGENKENGLLGFIGSGNNINYISPNNVLIDVSSNYPEIKNPEIQNDILQSENTESDAIIDNNENIDTSFNPAEWDENFAKQLEDEAAAQEQYEKMMIEELKENGAIPTIKSEKQRLRDMGIGRIVRPKKGDPNYGEYEHLSPRIRREFFYDEKDGLVNSKGYTWDQAEHTLQEVTGNDNASIWEELEDIERNVSRYEDLGLAVGGKGNNNITINKNIDDIVAPNNKPIDIIQVTSLPNLKNAKNGNLDLHVKAKAGDFDSAYKLIDNLLTVKRADGKVNHKANILVNKFKKIAQEYPNAVILPIIAKEASGHNMLPYAYAAKISQITGLKISDSIKQINETHHTGAGKAERLMDRAIFDGKVVPGLKYIIVDDVFTTGSNINELRKYIERRGGKVVNVAILGTGNQGRAFTLLEETKEKLYNKFTKEGINEYLRRNKIANSAEELTELQAGIILKQSKQSIDAGRAERNGQRFSSSEGKSESSRSEVLRRELNSEQSNNNSTDLSLSGKTRPAYSSALKTDVKINSNEKPKMSDFKLYQRTYDLAKKYMVNNIAESKYRPRNTLGVYYNYGSRKGNIYLNSLLNVDVVAHELVHAIDDKLQIINDLYEKGFKAATTFKGKKAITTFIPDISTPEGKAADELLKAAKDLYPTDISKQSVKSRLAEGLATLIQHSIINPDMIENFYGNAYKWAMSNETLQSFRDDARQIIVDYESLNPVEQLGSEIYDKKMQVKKKNEIPKSIIIDSQLFDSEAVMKMLDKDLYLLAKGYRSILHNVLKNNLTNKKGRMYIIDNSGNPVKVSDNVNWRTLIEDVQKAQSEFNGYLVARRFVAWYENRDKIANGIEVLGNNLKKLQQKYNEVSEKIKKDDFYNIHDQKAAYDLERSLRIEIDKLTRQIKQEGEKLANLQDIITANGKDETRIKDAYKFLDNPQNRELAKKYDFLMKCNLTVLKTAKLIDKELYNELVANYGYAPFNRAAYNEISGDGREFVEQFGAKNDVIPKIVSSNGKIKNLLKMKGSDLPIISPLYSSMQLMKEAYKKSYKQIVANKMGEIAELYPELMQERIYVSGDEKNKVVVIKTDKNSGKNIKRSLDIDPFIKNVWDNLVDNYRMSFWEKVMVTPAKIFTLGTTAENPIFAITNFIRDQVTAGVNSQTGYIPFIAPIVTYLKLRKNPLFKQYYQEYIELFGDSNTNLSNLEEINPDDLANAFKTNTISRIFKGIRTGLAFVPNLSEVVTRMTEYVKARAAGLDTVTSKRLADEVSIPFVDRGLWGGPMGRVLLRSVPYMNAGLQAVRQGVRDLTTKNKFTGDSNIKTRKKWLKTLFAMIGYGIIQYAADLWWDNTEDKTRKNLKEQLNPAQFLRYCYLPWGLSNTDLLRMPWEQLYSFPAVIASMLHDEMMNQYHYKLSEYAESATGGIIPDNFNIIVPMIKTIFEGDNSGWEQLFYRNIPQIGKIGLMLGGGKKTYPTLQDIVPKYLQKREKTMQYDEKTSDLAKFLGKQFNIAPIKIDYYIYNTLGQVGSMAEKGSEFAIDEVSGETNTTVKDFFTGNVTEKQKAFRKTIMPWLQESYFIYGREMQQFYDEKEKFEALEKSHKEGLRKLNSEELKYLSANAPHIKTISKRIKDYNKFVKNATDSRKNLTFKQQKENEQTKINMENQIIDLLRKWKRAVKKAA